MVISFSSLCMLNPWKGLADFVHSRDNFVYNLNVKWMNMRAYYPVHIRDEPQTVCQQFTLNIKYEMSLSNVSRWIKLYAISVERDESACYWGRH